SSRVGFGACGEVRTPTQPCRNPIPNSESGWAPLVAAGPPARVASRPTAGPAPTAGPRVEVGAAGARDTGGRLPSEAGLPVVSTVAERIARPGPALAGGAALLAKGARV
ncbi:hypothetical protein ABZV71_41085, partial [Streptomyces sp. NPDC004675]